MVDFTIVKNKNFMGMGYCLASGKILIEWYGDITSIVIYDKIDDVEKLHGPVKFSHQQEDVSTLSPPESPQKLQRGLTVYQESNIKLSP